MHSTSDLNLNSSALVNPVFGQYWKAIIQVFLALHVLMLPKSYPLCVSGTALAPHLADALQHTMLSNVRSQSMMEADSQNDGKDAQAYSNNSLAMVLLRKLIRRQSHNLDVGVRQKLVEDIREAFENIALEAAQFHCCPELHTLWCSDIACYQDSVPCG